MACTSTTVRRAGDVLEGRMGAGLDVLASAMLGGRMDAVLCWAGAWALCWMGVVMLDEHGLDVGSQQMAELIGDAGNTGASSLLFCIGGPYGHGRQLRERANISIKLSSLVLNHQIALVVLVEQLYRYEYMAIGRYNSSMYQINLDFYVSIAVILQLEKFDISWRGLELEKFDISWRGFTCKVVASLGILELDSLGSFGFGIKEDKSTFFGTLLKTKEKNSKIERQLHPNYCSESLEPLVLRI
ncbi:hypothetical protein RJ640_005856 [Escallonia rubra]|uniref:Uncharacterized protein n=1 Tax=Escallonia rubra TaxID=112253 RepID=A0AA88RS96_9ASTE|nr:hypothetical protein RJ640_005856 [Escallonia rubra]